MRKRNLLCVCLLIFVLFGCAANTGNDTNVKDAFVVGLDDTFAPMGFKNDQGEIVGFDVELAQETAKRLGMEVTFQNID